MSLKVHLSGNVRKLISNDYILRLTSEEVTDRGERRTITQIRSRASEMHRGENDILLR